MKILDKLAEMNCKVNDCRDLKGIRHIIISSPDGSIWCRIVFCPEDAPEVTRAKVQTLVKTCHDCLKIAV